MKRCKGVERGSYEEIIKQNIETIPISARTTRSGQKLTGASFMNIS